MLLAYLPALGLSLYSAAEDRAAALDEERKAAESWVRLAVTDHRRLVEGARQLLTAIAEIPEVVENRREESAALFARLLRSNPG